MLRDLLKSEEPDQSRSADVVVIGAGIAGLLVATRLSQLGVHTVVLESGSETAGRENDPLNEVVQVGQPYRGAGMGRFRGLGGTSSRWGGAMLPLSPWDLAPHTAGWPVDWPLTAAELVPYFRRIEQLFQLPEGPYQADPPMPAGCEADPAFVMRSAKWPAFRLRNIAHALRDDLKADRLEIWLNATLAGFELAPNGRVSAVAAVSPAGRRLEVKTQTVIIAAGAIESTRLLLLLDHQHGNRIFGRESSLGHYFHDHLSTSVATIEPADRNSINRFFGLRFVNGGMRDLRLEPAEQLRRSLALPGAFAHLAATSDTDTGFASLRAIYREMQKGSPVKMRDLAKLARNLGWLLNATRWRFIEKRLLFPGGAKMELVLVTEQMPNFDSTISLAADKKDRMGNLLAKIDWRTSAEDIIAFTALQAALCKWWDNSGLPALGRLDPIPQSHWRDRLQNSSDIFHPGGTTRMGRDAASGVVNNNLRTFQVENLYVLSTSAFPSGGSANPTFTLMALAIRAADHIAGRIANKVA